MDEINQGTFPRIDFSIFNWHKTRPLTHTKSIQLARKTLHDQDQGTCFCRAKF